MGATGCHRVPPQNNIPVLSPALTDGSLGDMIFFHSYKRPGLVLDIVEGEQHPGVPQGIWGALSGGALTPLCPQTCASSTPRPSSPPRPA